MWITYRPSLAADEQDALAGAGRRSPVPAGVAVDRRRPAVADRPQRMGPPAGRGLGIRRPASMRSSTRSSRAPRPPSQAGPARAGSARRWPRQAADHLATVSAVSEIAERYRRVAAGFTERVEAVPADRWTSASPCEGWDARAVVRHVVDAHGLFEGMVGRSLGDIPSVDDDPAGGVGRRPRRGAGRPRGSREGGLRVRRVLRSQHLRGRRSTASSPATSWSTPGTWPGRPGSTRPSRPTRWSEGSSRSSPWATRCAPPACSDRRSNRRPAPTPRPGCSATPAATPPGSLVRSPDGRRRGRCAGKPGRRVLDPTPEPP